MKKALIIAGALLGVAATVAGLWIVWLGFTITDPYVVKPLTASPAPNGAKVGHSIMDSTRTLSVVSSNGIAVVADPAAFKYEVLWLVEKPRKDGGHTLMEYRYQLPEYATAEHIHPMGSELPPKIQKVAKGESLTWE